MGERNGLDEKGRGQVLPRAGELELVQRSLRRRLALGLPRVLRGCLGARRRRVFLCKELPSLPPVADHLLGAYPRTHLQGDMGGGEAC